MPASSLPAPGPADAPLAGGRRAAHVVTFPVVGLGGSAGSMAAFEDFFQHLPVDCGLAVVVVVHLLAGHESEMAAVIQRFTALPVAQAENGQRVQPNHVYVIPPDHDLSLVHGTLLLSAPTQPAGRRLPIDFFFQSLAEDARERAVAVVCSGMGADGAVGLKRVMENFGMVMVQDPATAEYDSMPRAAIATEFVDYVLPAAQLPAKLLDYVRRPPGARPRPAAAGAAQPALQRIFALVRARTGHDFSLYKRSTLLRRIERRMNAHQVKDLAQYVRFLGEYPAEVGALFRELLIGVTTFFRDPEAFEHLQAHLLPLLRPRPAGRPVRVWAPGCSTGEEAYSLAMCLLEALDGTDPAPRPPVQIFATDINPDGIDAARLGRYPDSIAGAVSPARLARFFTHADGYYRVKKEVRDVVVFAVHNLLRDAPITQLDLLVCRNLLIYFAPELQRRLIPSFHYALRPGGLLFLGPSETLTGFPDLFAPLDAKWKISRRRPASASARAVTFPLLPYHPAAAAAPAAAVNLPRRPMPPPPPLPPPARKDALAALVQRVLLRHHTPPAVVIDAAGTVLYVNGRTGRYLEPAPGAGAMNVFDMARPELKYDLSEAVHRAAAAHAVAVAERVAVATDAGPRLLRLTVQPLTADAAGPADAPLAGLLLVLFEDQPAPPAPRRGKAAPAAERPPEAVSLEKELLFTRHRLQTTIEDLESSVEELQSTNEELQSANEELQSTNEEAMTNREELQSLNEELMTLNTQYLSKSEELSLAANDMKNLLDATEIATIFLGNDMTIKRFTPAVQRIIPLRPGDVGRLITDFATTLRRDTLEQDVRRVLDKLVGVDANIQTTGGEWFAMRILPYRTLDNYISGAVVTFADVTALKTLEGQLQESTWLAESIVETVPQPLLVLDARLRVLAVSLPFAQLFGLDAAAAKGQPLHALDGGAWQQPALRQRLDALLADPAAPFDDFRLAATFPGAGPRALRLYGRALTSDGRLTGGLLLGVEEVG